LVFITPLQECEASQGLEGGYKAVPKNTPLIERAEASPIEGQVG
jgi:hypothetical protein